MRPSVRTTVRAEVVAVAFAMIGGAAPAAAGTGPSAAVCRFEAHETTTQGGNWITPGSAIGVLLWLICSLGFRVYLHFFNSYSKTYGSLGAVIILLLWFYVTGLVFLVGGEINAQIENSAAERGHPEAKEQGKKAA